MKIEVSNGPVEVDPASIRVQKEGRARLITVPTINKFARVNYVSSRAGGVFRLDIVPTDRTEIAKDRDKFGVTTLTISDPQNDWYIWSYFAISDEIRIVLRIDGEDS